MGSAFREHGIVYKNFKYSESRHSADKELEMDVFDRTVRNHIGLKRESSCPWSNYGDEY